MAGQIYPQTLMPKTQPTMTDAPPPWAGVAIPGFVQGPSPWTHVPGGALPHGVPQRLPQAPFPAPTGS